MTNNPNRFIVFMVALLLLSLLSASQVWANNDKSALANEQPDLQKEPDVVNQVYLPFVTNANRSAQFLNQVSVSQDLTDPTLLPPPIANSYTFVTGTGGDLDQYLGRSNLANGRLAFSIGISSPKMRPEWVNPDDS